MAAAPSSHHGGHNQHYSLRWNNHQKHVLSAFDELLQREAMVDCTLVCDDTSVRAHKVVLSACSPYFCKIFEENPGKHPIIVLRDILGWQIQCIVDFMYKGETSVPESQLQCLIKAAESLKVRGLTSGPSEGNASSRGLTVEETPSPYGVRQYTPSPSPQGGVYPGGSADKHSGQSSPISLTNQGSDHEARSRSPQGGSSGPRRKQARPRRRSGDSVGGGGNASLDLTKDPAHTPDEGHHAPENLCLKRPSSSPAINLVKMETLLEDGGRSASRASRQADLPSSSSDDRRDNNLNKASPTSSSSSSALNGMSAVGGHLGHFAAAAAVAAAAGNGVHSMGEHEARVEALQALNYMAAGGGLPPFPHHPGLPLPPPGSHAPSHAPAHPHGHISGSLGGLSGLSAVAAASRPPSAPATPSGAYGAAAAAVAAAHRKGQHSAPRGGPPRSWTNEDLTKALENVWNKRMTTSQASRIYGIPYNSLLMYVRGKYGKSLKLDRLKQTTPAAHDNLNTIGNSRTTPKEKIHAQQQQQLSEQKRSRERKSSNPGLDSRASELPSLAFGSSFGSGSPGSNSPMSPGFSSRQTATPQTPPSSSSSSASPLLNPYAASQFFSHAGGFNSPSLQDQIGLLRMLPGHAAAMAAASASNESARSQTLPGLAHDTSRVRELMLSMQREHSNSLLNNSSAVSSPAAQDNSDEAREPQSDELMIDEDAPSDTPTTNASASFLALAAHAVNAASARNGSVGSSRSPGSLEESGTSNDETEEKQTDIDMEQGNKSAEEKERQVQAILSAAVAAKDNAAAASSSGKKNNDEEMEESEENVNALKGAKEIPAL